VSSVSPIQLILQHLHERGYTAVKVEHWNHYAKRRQDLFNSSMCLAMNEGHMLAIQFSDGSYNAEHVKKIMALPVARLLAYHMTIEIWSWSPKLTGRRKLWAHLLGSAVRSRSCACSEARRTTRFCVHDLAVCVVVW
jgi:hypothetical protein